MKRAISVTSLALLALLACHREEEWRSFGGSEKASFVVVFKHDASPKAVFQFIEGRLGVETPKGTYLLPGMNAIVKVGVEDYEAYAVYMNRASAEERQMVKDRMLAAPIVLAVFEGVAPEQVKLGTSTAATGREGRHATANSTH
jgi:hypothetical protein